MAEPVLPPDATLAIYQQYIADVLRKRGLASDDIAQRFMLLLEEMGELSRAARGHTGMKMADDTGRAELAHEAADVFIVFIGLCNMLRIDLDQAVRDKEEINKTRIWK